MSVPEITGLESLREGEPETERPRTGGRWLLPVLTGLLGAVAVLAISAEDEQPASIRSEAVAPTSVAAPTVAQRPAAGADRIDAGSHGRAGDASATVEVDARRQSGDTAAVAPANSEPRQQALKPGKRPVAGKRASPARVSPDHQQKKATVRAKVEKRQKPATRKRRVKSPEEPFIPD